MYVHSGAWPILNALAIRIRHLHLVRLGRIHYAPCPATGLGVVDRIAERVPGLNERVAPDVGDADLEAPWLSVVASEAVGVGDAPVTSSIVVCTALYVSPFFETNIIVNRDTVPVLASIRDRVRSFGVVNIALELYAPIVTTHNDAIHVRRLIVCNT